MVTVALGTAPPIGASSSDNSMDGVGARSGRQAVIQRDQISRFQLQA